MDKRTDLEPWDYDYNSIGYRAGEIIAVGRTNDIIRNLMTDKTQQAIDKVNRDNESKT